MPDERHPLDPVSLLFGVLFTVVGVAFLVADWDVLSAIARQWQWLGPLALVTAGVWIVVTSFRRRDERDAGAAER